MDLLVNATDKATGESLSDLERTNQAFVMVMSGDYPSVKMDIAKAECLCFGRVCQMYILHVFMSCQRQSNRAMQIGPVR